MIQVNISQAKAQLAELIAKVNAGEQVVICRHNKPVAELVSKVPAPPRVLGKKALGIVEVAEDFDAPMSFEELEEWEKPIEP